LSISVSPGFGLVVGCVGIEDDVVEVVWMDLEEAEMASSAPSVMRTAERGIIFLRDTLEFSSAYVGTCHTVGFTRSILDVGGLAAALLSPSTLSLAIGVAISKLRESFQCSCWRN